MGWNLLDWFTGREMTAQEVADMSHAEIEAGIIEIGPSDPDANISEMADEIRRLAIYEAYVE